MLLWRKTGGSRLQGLAEGDVLAGDRAEGGGRVGDRVGEVVAALGDRGRELARVDDEAFEEALVGVQFADEGVGPVQRGAEVLGGLVAVLAAAGVEGGLALDEVGEAAAHRLREAVEELVEVGGGRRFGEAERGAVVERRVVVGARG